MARGLCRHAPGVHENIDPLSTTYIHTAQRSRASPTPDLLVAAIRQLHSCMLSTPKLRSSGDQFRARRKRTDLILVTRLRGFVLSTYVPVFGSIERLYQSNYVKLMHSESS